eukprot:snap_masked-scaffold_4-processed-gene-9.2-mRNA-1 protein AED:1.00 eAED:1.00 QI:0/-1/0/0/-1/1/1/0/115
MHLDEDLHSVKGKVYALSRFFFLQTAILSQIQFVPAVLSLLQMHKIPPLVERLLPLALKWTPLYIGTSMLLVSVFLWKLKMALDIYIISTGLITLPLAGLFAFISENVIVFLSEP